MSVRPSRNPIWGAILISCLSVACGEVRVTNLPAAALSDEVEAPSSIPEDTPIPETTLPGTTHRAGEPSFVPEQPPPVSDPTAELLDELAVIVPADDLPTYVRKDWPHWDDVDKDCQNTRAEVLIVESYATVSFKTDKSCTVQAGEWFDPYTNMTFYEASELDIDHMVPLKNAHLSGAHAWTKDERRAFANEMSHPEHLIAVKAGANRSKGARGPEAWKPPAEDHWCDYATHWIQIKWRWELSVTPDEHDALADMLSTC